MSFPVCSVSTLFQSEAKRKLQSYVTLRKRGFRTALPVLFQELNTNVSQNHKVWIEPEGYESGINIYNSLSKSKVPFRTLNPGMVTWYNCGPTVYDSAHIGHALCFVKLDIIRRLLEDIFHLNVVQVTGITDIDEKILNRAQQLQTSPHILTEKYEKEFFEDMQKLNVRPPSATTRVSQYIPHIHSFIQRIIEKGNAYAVAGSVYFDVSSDGRTTKFVRETDSDFKSQRIKPRSDKKSAKDFALWRGSHNAEIFWDSPWGPGIPGWHIECSVMASHIFGDRLDLHSGGIDLMFPHHENEERQCCSYHNCDQWCNYWIHTGHLHASGDEKMSKSLKNTISVEQFLQDYSSNLFRLFCLSSNYRTFVDYSSERMDEARTRLNKIMAFFQDSQAYIQGSTSSGDFDGPLILEKLDEVRIKIYAALVDNFDTRTAMFLLFEIISLCNNEFNKKKVGKAGRSAGTVAAVRGYVQVFLTRLGMKFEHQLLIDEPTREETYLPTVLDSTMSFRKKVRDFALLRGQDVSALSKDEKKKMMQERAPLLTACDRMRDEFNVAGVQLKDHASLSSWSLHKPQTLQPPEKEGE